MNYNDVVVILNRHIFEASKLKLLERIASNPERYTGLFRPTKPRAKLLQNLLQSHEIRFGDAMESFVRAILADIGFSNLPQYLQVTDGDALSVDQYFTDGERYYFVEQKVRDDHDSTKKRGQIRNFEKKLDVLYMAHRDNLTGIMYFIDPDLTKNRNYYTQELSRLKQHYSVDIFLFYGREFFEYLGYPLLWDDLIAWLAQWKADLPDMPPIDFDLQPQESFEEIKALELRHWHKLFANNKIWSEGIIQVLFSTGVTLQILLEYFSESQDAVYLGLAQALRERLEQYYR